MKFLTKILLLITFISVYSFSQPSILENIRRFEPQEKLVIRNWNTNDGLPQNSVSFIQQDKDGYLWFITFSGLVRFDGYEFKIYNTREYPQLQSDRINRLFIDSKNRFWISNELAKIIIFDGYEFQDITEKFSRDFFVITNITEDSKGNIYIANNSAELFIYKDGEVKKVNDEKQINSNQIFSFNISSADISDTIIYFFDSKKAMLVYEGEIIRSKKMNKSYQLLTHIVRNERGIWFISDKKLYRTDSFDNIDKAEVLFNKIRFISIQQYDSDILASTDDGKIFIIKKDLTYETILSPGLIQLYYPNFSMFIDREENLWVGSALEGLYQIRKKFLYNLDESFGSKVNNIYPIYKSSDGTIWLGYNPGLSRIRNNKIENLITDKIFPSWGIAEDVNNDVWVVTNGAGIMIYKNDNSSFLFHDDTLYAKTNIFFNSIYRDKNDDLWLGSIGVVVKIDKNYHISYFYPDTITSNGFKHFIEDEKGNLWLASDYGVYKFDGNSFELISEFDIKFARSFYIDSNNRFWVGSYGDGLRVKSNGKYFTITQKEGLYSNIISAIVEDGNGSYWFTSNTGLFKVRESEIDDYISGKTNHIISTNYGKDEGLSNIEFNGGCQPSWMRDDEGNLWFPSFGGPIILDIKSYLELRSIPEVSIEYFMLDDEKIFPSDKISLPSEYSKFTIKFNTPSYYSPNNVRFKYMLEGLDKDWQLIERGRSITYPKLPYGNYVFNVYAIDGFGNKSEIASLPFYVEAKIYETIWFYLFVFNVLIVALILFFNVKLKRAKNRQLKLEKVVNERTESLRLAKEQAENLAEEEKILRASEEESNRQKTELLRLVSHDLKNPIFGIKGYSEILQSDDKLSEDSRYFADKIYELGENIQELVEQLLDFSRFEANHIQLNSQIIDVNNEIIKVIGNFELAAKNKNQKLIHKYEESPHKILIDPLHLKEILNNLVSNAIKYSDFDKEIFIKVESTDGKVKIVIKDYGQGFSKEDIEDLYKPFKKLSSKPTNSESSTGLGLSIVKKLIDLNNGTIEIESEKGVGTTFTIYFAKTDSQ